MRVSGAMRRFKDSKAISNAATLPLIMANERRDAAQ